MNTNDKKQSAVSNVTNSVYDDEYDGKNAYDNTPESDVAALFDYHRDYF